MQLLSVVASALLAVQACALQIPPRGSTVVSKTPLTPMQRVRWGGNTTFTTIQAAVDSLDPKQNATLFIYPGVYEEQVAIFRKQALTVYGYSADTMDYRKNRVLITANNSALVLGNNDRSGTLRAHLPDFTMFNVDVRNEFTASQAIAVSAVGPRQAYLGCRLMGYQDTLLTSDGTHYFGHSLIEGAVDYIFGQRSRAYFYKTDMRSVGPGWTTANGRDSVENVSVYVFNRCTVDKSEKAKNGTDGNVLLGRPWRSFARVLFMNTYLWGGLNPAGWAKWQPNDTPANVSFLEFNNTGPGASQLQRVNFSRTLRSDELKDFTMLAVLNSTFWIPPAFL